MSSRGVRILLGLATLLLTGCLTPTYNDVIFDPAWKWANGDGFELDFAIAPAASASLVRLYADRDDILKTRGTAFEVGRRFEPDSATARTIVLEARAEGLLGRRDAVESCWQLDPGWRLGGSLDRKTGLIVASSKKRFFVLVRGHASWQRHEVDSHVDHHSSAWKCAFVVAACVPAWAVTVALDAPFLFAGACANGGLRGDYVPDWRPDELRQWAQQLGRR